MLEGKTFLITGIADKHSLAMYVAKKVIAFGGRVVCTGLGMTQHHQHLSEKAKAFLNQTYKDFQQCIEEELGKEALTGVMDVTLEASLDDFFAEMKEKEVHFDGFLHAIAMDKTIRKKIVKPLLEVSLDEFTETMDVSAYSLIKVTKKLFDFNIINKGASICSISYIAAEKVTYHPYRNISIAKAALERITIELADELGRKHGTRVNCVRFSPYMGSKAGNATLDQKDIDYAEKMSPLGNALPEDLAYDVVNLFRPNARITGEIRHIDGGYHIMG